MKTKVYIDGYNLYYGRLKNTPYKWLDIVKLFTHIVRVQSPASELVAIDYFTAPCLGRFSRRPESVHIQQSYLRALEQNPILTIVQGFHSAERTCLPAYHQATKRPNLDDKHWVWRVEEKQTDVNIVLGLVLDAIDGLYDQFVIVSNDSDLEPALKSIRDRDLSATIGVVVPAKQGRQRPASAGLMQYADWTRHHILDVELAEAQLSNKIPTRKKPIFKPSHW